MELSLKTDSPPGEARLTLKAGRSLALPHRVPLSRWGFEGSLHYSTAELFMAKETATGTALLLHGDGPGELALRIGEPLAVEAPGEASTIYGDGQLTVLFSGEDFSCTVRCRNGRELKLGVIGRERALLVKEIGADGEVVFEQPPVYPTEAAKDAATGWSLRPFDAPARFPPAAYARSGE